MTHPVHPAVLARFRRVMSLHRSVHPAGELTSVKQVQAIDPEGLLSLVEEIGVEKVREVLSRGEVSRRAEVEELGWEL